MAVSVSSSPAVVAAGVALAAGALAAETAVAVVAAVVSELVEGEAALH